MSTDTSEPSLPVPMPLLPAVVRWLGVGSVAAIILYYSLFAAATDGDVAFLDVAISYVLHFAAYAGLGATLAYALADRPLSTTRKVLAVFLVVMMYGLAIELAQGLIADRTASLLDGIVNACGGAASLSWYGLERRVRFVRVELLRR